MDPKKAPLDEDVLARLDNMDEEVLKRVMFSSPWQSGSPNPQAIDEDGFGYENANEKGDSSYNLKE